MENVVVASASCLAEGFEDIELSVIAELLDSCPQKIGEKYFRDVIASNVDKGGQQRLPFRTQKMLKHLFTNQNAMMSQRNETQSWKIC